MTATTSTPMSTRAADTWQADLHALTKPRIAIMVVLTTVVGYHLGATTGLIQPAALIATIIGVLLTAVSSSIFNQVLERDTDAQMKRTADRPLPTGRIPTPHAVGLGLATGVGGLAILAGGVNLWAMACTAFTVVTYVLVYTPLKTRTRFNTIVGAIPGAMPPVIGWAAASNGLEPGALVLFAILFVWQLPHFLSIAWLYRDDYEAGGHKMLPLDDADGERTARQMVFHCVTLCVVTVAPFAFQLGGWVYLVGGSVVSGLFLVASLGFWKARTARRARLVLGASLIYLPGVFGLLAFGL